MAVAKTRAAARQPRSKRFSAMAVVWWFGLFAVVCAVAMMRDAVWGRPGMEAVDEVGEVASDVAARKLLSGGIGDFNPIHTETGYKGPLGAIGIIVWIPATVWIFSGVAIAADEYFQPALEGISDALDLSADVRGATFLAAASSAPEFFTSFADTFLVSEAGGEGFGVGTIVGSAVFNVLIIVALSTLPTLNAKKDLEENKPKEPTRKPQHTEEQWQKVQADYEGRIKAWENKLAKLEKEGSYLPVDWYPLCRDTVFYTLSIIVLVTTVASDEPGPYDRRPDFKQGCVKWGEALVYIILYAFYILFMIKSADYRMFWEGVKEKFLSCCTCCRVDDAPTEFPSEPAGAEGPLDVEAAAAELRTKETLEKQKEHESDVAFSDGDDSDDEEEGGLFSSVVEFEDPWNEVGGAFCNIMGIFAAPWKFLFTLTIPNTNRGAMKKHYILSFVMCIIWIAFLSAMMVKVVSWIGSIIGLHPVVMGLVVLAAGTSVPDALGSYNEAKHGNADAAVSNALGSNVFDICVGLGVPWFIYALIKDRCFAVPAEEVLIPTFILFFVLCMFLFTLAYFKMRLSGVVGKVYLAVYVVFVLWVLINGIWLNVKL
eukprot:TRINITY_DN1111_c0_g1_i1.p1 TRINITY_DN1111_c0_g1~~TRINITY_DN1111_c0_g1_i1.p1  ORF type:complete len:599 (+),score=256.95 TRINITY_DN1111_c0_g1_i1:94-1890(+)